MGTVTSELSIQNVIFVYKKNKNNTLNSFSVFF